MSRALVELHFEVHLLTLPFGDNVEIEHVVHHRVAKIPFVKQVPAGFSFAKIPYNILLFFKLLRLLRQHQFSAVHAIEEAALYAIHVARLFGVAAICDLDSDLCSQLRANPSPVVRVLGRLAALPMRWSLRAADAAITVAYPLTELVKRESPGTPIIEVRDVPLADALRTPSEEGMASIRASLRLEGRKSVVYTGNLDRRQGVEELVQAIAIVQECHPDCVLVIVGGAARDVDRVRSLAQTLGIVRTVRLVGTQPIKTMPEYMGIAAVLASPRLEPMVTPLKIYSYMASGRPIVATDLPTHTDVLDEWSAVLTAATPAGLAAGIMRVLENPVKSERLGQAARNLVLTRHNFAAFKEGLREAYSTAIRN